MRSLHEYLLSLNDGRAVFVGGELVANVAEETGFLGAAQTIGKIIDLPRVNEAHARWLDLCGATGPTPYHIPKSRVELTHKGRCFEEVATLTGGFMARTPDFLAALLASWVDSASFFGKRAENVIEYYRHSALRGLCHTHAISDPPGDRYLAKNSALKKVDQSSDGIYVSGTKMLATLAPLSDEIIVYPYKQLPEDAADKALAFAVPIASDGLRLISRSPSVPAQGNALDYPLGWHLDEVDCICMFDGVFVPYERVFIDGDVASANHLRQGTAMLPFLWHQSAIRAAVGARTVAGLAISLARFSGRDRHAEVQSMLGELMAQAQSLDAMIHRAEACSIVADNGTCLADIAMLSAVKTLAFGHYERAIAYLRKIGASDLVSVPSKDTLDRFPELGAHFGMGTSNNNEAHIRTLRLASELCTKAFGGRQLLYEEFYLGPQTLLKSGHFERGGSQTFVDRLQVALFNS